MRSLFRHLWAYLALGLLVVMLIFFLWPTTSRDDESLTVVASIFPVANIASEIVGDRASVIQLLPSGLSPHTYEPTPSDQIEIYHADALFVIGLGLDDFVADLASDGNSNAQLVELYQGVNTLSSIDTHESDHYDEYESDNNHERVGADPHFFTSVSGAKVIAETIFHTMAEIDAANELFYQQRYEAYILQLNTLLIQSRSRLSSLDERGLVTFHDAFSYFADELDLTVYTTIEPYAGKEPTIAYLAEVGKIIREYDVQALFSEPQLSDSVVQPLVRDYGIAAYVLDPLGGVSGRDSFILNYQYNVDTVYQALRK